MITWTTPQLQRADVSAFLMRFGDGYSDCRCDCDGLGGSGYGS